MSAASLWTFHGSDGAITNVVHLSDVFTPLGYVSGLTSLANVAAATLYDAIGRAETSAELDELSKKVSCSWGGGAILDDDATFLFEYIAGRRRPARQDTPGFRQLGDVRRGTAPGFLLPKPNEQPITRFPKRRVQRSRDKQASYDRRHRLAYSGVMPPHLAARLTPGDMAIMRVVADEYRRVGRCELSRDEIAARSGGCPMAVRRAMNKARGQRLISIEERPVRGQKHRTNLVHIISLEWLKWLRRPLVERPKASLGEPVASTQRKPIGVHLRSPTDKSLKDDCADDRNHSTTPAAAAPPQSGQPSKEANEFAAELANICGYRQATVPRSWQEANPPRVVQIWLNELAGNHPRPVDALRMISLKVMRRKQLLHDPSPPYSPRYFSAEIKKFVEQSARFRRRNCNQRAIPRSV